MVPLPVAVRQEESLACEPHQLAKAYSRDIQYLTLTVPGSLKAVSQAVFERERARAPRQWEEATELI